MTLESDDVILPQWRTVFSARLQRSIQVRRPTVRDTSRPIEELWLSLCRDADGSPLLPKGTQPGECDAEIVSEIITMATSHPTAPLVSTGSEPRG